VAINLVGSDAPGPAVVDRAVAATTRGGVYHVVEYTTLRGSPEATRDLYAEAWYTSDGRLHRKAFQGRNGQKGEPLEEFAGRWRPGRRSGALLTWDARSNTISEGGFASGGGGADIGSFSDPGSQLRALEEKGRLEPAGTTTVDGRRAHRLTGKSAGVEIEITVDAKTYLPLSQRYTDGKFVSLIRYLSYERTPLNDETEQQLALDRHPGAKCSEFAHELTEKRDLGFPNPCRKR
jgi:hypothetical protein